MEKAVMLLSGGLDSTTCMAVAKEQGKELYPISFCLLYTSDAADEL